MKNENLFERGRAVRLLANDKRRKKIAAFLLALCMLMSNLPYGMMQEVYAAFGMLAENVEIDDVVYKEIEPGKMQIVAWNKEIGYQATVEIPGKVTYDGKEYTVTSIGDSAFYQNAHGNLIIEVIFPDTIESIGQEAFRSCFDSRFEVTLTLPPNLKEIGKNAFWCSYLSGELVIPDSVVSIGEQAFRETQISSLVISNPDIVYGSQAFAYNTKLTGAQLPDGMASLGGEYFLWGCKNLEKIDMPESITSIPKSALSGCASLTEIHIPDSVNQIGSSAFLGCTGVKEIVVPEGVTEILSYTFRNCSEDLRVTLPDSITYVDSRAFWDGKTEQEKYSKSITVKCTSKEVAALVAGIGHKNILLNDEVYDLITFDTNGYTYTVTDSENKYVQLDKWAGTKPSGEVAIPETVTWDGIDYTVKTIGENAFSQCLDLKKITLPNTVTEIGTRAFYLCKKLESINLPEGITRIEQMTFYNCPLLTDLTLPSSLQYIGSFAFQECAGLQQVEIPESCALIDTGVFWDCTGLTEVTLREGITEIGSNMFCNCAGIKEIRLPDSVQKIGGCAFQNCTGLEKITLNQGLTEIGQMVFKGCDKLTGTIVLPDSVMTIRQDAFVDSGLSGVRVGSGLTVLESGAFPDTVRLATYNLEVWKLLMKNTDRENAPVFLWDGACDVPVGIQTYVEDDLVISEDTIIPQNAVVTILDGATLTIDAVLTNHGSITGGGDICINGSLLGSGSVGDQIGISFRLSEEMVQEIKDQVYGIAPATPEPVVSTVVGEEKIVFGRGLDYTCQYENNTAIGEAGVTITPLTGRRSRLTGEAVTKHFSIIKQEQEVPECILSFNKNADGETFTAVIEEKEGAEYSFDGENWTEENQKTDCRPNTSYTGYIRMKEDETRNPSAAVSETKTTPKLEQESPACSLAFAKNADGKTFTGMIGKVEGAEYSFDGKNWTEENQKTDCQPNTSYTGYIRMKETESHFASLASRDTKTTPKLPAVGGNGQNTGNTLSAPSILACKANADKGGVFVTISVSPVTGADRYEIYRTAGAKTIKVGTTLSGKTSLQDTNPVKSASYYAIVLSKDGALRSGAGAAKAFQLVKAMKIKKVSSGSKGITVSWKKNKNAVKYVIYRSSKKKTGYTKIKTLSKKKVSFVDKKAKKGKSYYYKIAVITKSNVSLMSSASKKVKR